MHPERSPVPQQRRYHAILTAATLPPLGRVRTVSKFEETLVIDGSRSDLSTDQFPGTVTPDGYRYISEFRLDPFPVGDMKPETCVRAKDLYGPRPETPPCVDGPSSKAVSIPTGSRPQLAFVDHHGLQHENAQFNREIAVLKGSVKVQPIDGLTSVYIGHNAASVVQTGYWYRDFEYAIERERGFDFHEDLYQPFELSFDLKTSSADIIISTEQIDPSDAASWNKAEIDRRRTLIETADLADEFDDHLVLAADQFIVSRGSGQTIIAGYPWFSDWGRDTMISLAGLTLKPTGQRSLKVFCSNSQSIFQKG